MPILEKFVQYASLDGPSDDLVYRAADGDDNASAFHQESIARIMNGGEGTMLNGTSEQEINRRLRQADADAVQHDHAANSGDSSLTYDEGDQNHDGQQ